MPNRKYQERLHGTYSRTQEKLAAAVPTELDTILAMPHPQREFAFVEWSRRTSPKNPFPPKKKRIRKRRHVPADPAKDPQFTQ